MKTLNARTASAVLSSLAATLLVGAFVPGCGEAEPPPMQVEQLEDLQKKQQEIFTKEYGPKAVKTKKS